MKNLNCTLIFGFALSLAGCAHGSKNNHQSAAVDANQGAEYLKFVGSRSVRVLEGGAQCPLLIKSVKNQNWREQVNVINACVLKKQWRTVEQLANQMATTEHMAPWGAYYLSLAAESRNEMHRAMWMIELALKKAPRSGLLTYQQGRLQWLSGDHSTAKKTLQKAIGMDRKLTDAHLLLGQMALVNNETKEAGQRFQAALAVEPRFLPALLGFAEVAIRSKDTKAAASTLAQAVLIHPQSTQARVRQAQVFETLEKNLPEALTAYRRLKTLERARKLDVAVEIDLDGKIRELESAEQSKNSPKNELSLREPAENKKGPK